MTSTIDSIRAELLRYKALAEGAIAQVQESDLSTQTLPTNNSIATIVWHISGNFESRFTDFLTTDGEKPWRHREEEFEPRAVTKAELLVKWNRGWDVVLTTLSGLTDQDLHRTVVIRGQSLQVNGALHRSLAHVAYHVGQIVYIGKSLLREDWDFLSIPPGQSDAYNRAPDKERTPTSPAQRERRPDAPHTETRRIAGLLRQSVEGPAYYGPSVLGALDGVTAEVAAKVPTGGGHSIWRLVGHLTAELQYAIRLLEGTAEPWIEDQTTWPAVTHTSGEAWERATAGLIETNRALATAVERLDDGVLDTLLVPVKTTYHAVLVGCAQHNAYHAGQIVLLKKQAALPLQSSDVGTIDRA